EVADRLADFGRRSRIDTPGLEIRQRNRIGMTFYIAARCPVARHVERRIARSASLAVITHQEIDGEAGCRWIFRVGGDRQQSREYDSIGGGDIVDNLQGPTLVLVVAPVGIAGEADGRA